MGIFVIQGAVIGLIGCAVGVVLGVILALNVGEVVAFIEHLFGISFLPKDIYFISEMPSDLRLPDVVRIGSVSVVLSLLATLYPSFRASRLAPAEALRYE
jgi:lipoprotein-releasing system permease protein